MRRIIVTKKNNVGKELKALGNELAGALKQIRSSKEFKDLEKEIGSSIKGITKTLGKSLQAAKESPNTARIKTHLGRVAKAGVAQGTVEVRKAQATAITGLRKAVTKLRHLKTKLKKSS